MLINRLQQKTLPLVIFTERAVIVSKFEISHVRNKSVQLNYFLLQ